jgi:hypothetical protein
MRSETLRKTRLFGSFIGSDICFLAELSLYGKFWEVREPLLIRRLHDAASSSLSLEELVTFYHPTRPAGRTMRRWRHLAENLRSIWRAPLGVSESLKATSALGRQAYWQRTELVHEVTGAVRSFFGGVAPSN